MESTEVHGKKRKRKHGGGKFVGNVSANSSKPQPHGLPSEPPMSEAAPHKKAKRELEPETIESEMENDNEDFIIEDNVAGASDSEQEPENPNFGGEKSQDGVNAYTIGLFRDYWEADTFKKYMREMGVKDAWIVPFKDGQRVDIKDVLEGVVNEKPAGTN